MQERATELFSDANVLERERIRNSKHYLLILTTRKLEVELINSVKVSSQEENAGY